MNKYNKKNMATTRTIKDNLLSMFVIVIGVLKNRKHLKPYLFLIWLFHVKRVLCLTKNKITTCK